MEMIMSSLSLSPRLKRFTPSERREIVWAAIFLLPTLFFLVVLTLYPIIYAFWISLHDWSLIPREYPFIGLDNYIRALQDNVTIKSLTNTFVYTLVTVPISMVLSLGLALILNQKNLPFRNLFRAIYFIPVITSWAAVSFVWRWLFEPRYGAVNSILGSLGIYGVTWLASPQWALPAIMVVAIWKSMGYNMVIFLAGLQGIPQEYYEAARIDGANRWQLFWTITFPLLNPTIVFVTVTAVIASLQVFTPVALMTAPVFGSGEAGGPIYSTRVMVYHIYSTAFRSSQLGYGAAQAFILFAFVLIVTIVQLRVTRRDVSYD
jgi:multiple sugar transport system permease protein